MVNFKDLHRTIEEWKQSFIAAAQRVLVAEELALSSPDELSLKLDLQAAWGDYRDICRNVLELVPINPIFAGVPQLILSEVIAAAEYTKSAKAIVGPRLGTFIPASTPEEAEALQTMAQRLQDTTPKKRRDLMVTLAKYVEEETLEDR